MASRVHQIKKYTNRRLYDTLASKTVTLPDIRAVVLAGESIQVIDTKSGSDVTRGVLLQIILEEEAGSIPLLSADVLSQIILLYGNAMQGVLGEYIEANIRLATELQHTFKDQISALYGGSEHTAHDSWKLFIGFQGPAMRLILDSYTEKTQDMFERVSASVPASQRRDSGPSH